MFRCVHTANARNIFEREAGTQFTLTSLQDANLSEEIVRVCDNILRETRAHFLS